MKEKIKLKEGSFEYAFYEKIAPAVKRFLASYFGDKLLNLESKSYSEIETGIQENVYYKANMIPDILYSHRTIKDADEWDNAFDNFVKPSTDILWPVTQHWFCRDFGTSDDEDSYLEDTYDFDLTYTERQAKRIIEAADELITDAQDFALFMRTGYTILNPIARKFIEEIAIFDLSILSVEGLNALQSLIDMMTEMLLEDMYSIIQNQ